MRRKQTMTNQALKKHELTINISPQSRTNIITNTTFFSMDVETGKKIINFTHDNTPVDLTNATVLLGFEFVGLGTSKIIDSKDGSVIVTTPTTGQCEVILPNHIYNYEGQVLIHAYIKYDDGRSLDAGVIVTEFEESWLDQELEEMTDFYVKRFEDLAQEIRARVDVLRKEMNAELKDVRREAAEAKEAVRIFVSEKSDLINNTKNEIQNFKDKHKTKIQDFIRDVKDSVNQSIATSKDELSTFSKGQKEIIAQSIVEAKDNLNSYNANLETEVRALINQLQNQVRDNIIAQETEFANMSEEIRFALREKLEDLKNATELKRALKEVMSELQDQFEDDMDNILRLAAEIRAELKANEAAVHDFNAHIENDDLHMTPAQRAQWEEKFTAVNTNINTRSAIGHIHNANDISEGTLAIGRIPTGTTATTVALGNHTHPAQTTITGNAATATTLQTARTINGTSFNGSANITTTNWGTARNITIGNLARSVNGSANIAWTLADIGAAPASHTHAANQITGTLTTAQLPIGTTATTVALGDHTHTAAQVGARASNWVPAWGDITGRPSTFTPIIGTTATTAAAGNHTHANPPDVTPRARFMNTSGCVGIHIKTNIPPTAAGNVFLQFVGDMERTTRPIDTQINYHVNASGVVTSSTATMINKGANLPTFNAFVDTDNTLSIYIPYWEQRIYATALVYWQTTGTTLQTAAQTNRVTNIIQVTGTPITSGNNFFTCPTGQVTNSGVGPATRTQTVFVATENGEDTRRGNSRGQSCRTIAQAINQTGNTSTGVLLTINRQVAAAPAAYDAAVNYTVGQRCTSGGFVWERTTAGTGTTPALTAAVWRIVLETSTTLQTGCTWRGAYSTAAATTYAVGDVVTFATGQANNPTMTYVCLIAIAGNNNLHTRPSGTLLPTRNWAAVGRFNPVTPPGNITISGTTWLNIANTAPNLDTIILGNLVLSRNGYVLISCPIRVGNQLSFNDSATVHCSAGTSANEIVAHHVGSVYFATTVNASFIAHNSTALAIYRGTTTITTDNPTRVAVGARNSKVIFTGTTNISGNNRGNSAAGAVAAQNTANAINPNEGGEIIFSGGTSATNITITISGFGGAAINAGFGGTVELNCRTLTINRNATNMNAQPTGNIALRAETTGIVIQGRNCQTINRDSAVDQWVTNGQFISRRPPANPLAPAATANAGSSQIPANSDHVHPLQTTITGNAATATSLQTARSINLTGAVTGSVSTNLGGTVNIATTVNHTHTAAQVGASPASHATDVRQHVSYLSNNSFTFNSVLGDYPEGMSVFSITSPPEGHGWPTTTGMVITNRNRDNLTRGDQVIVAVSSGQRWTRTTHASNVWTELRDQSTGLATSAALAPQATATVGTSRLVARQDHRHPFPSRLNGTRAVTLTGAVTGTVNSDFSGTTSIATTQANLATTAALAPQATATVGTSTLVARQDHRHPFPSRLNGTRAITLTGAVTGTVNSDFSGTTSIATAFRNVASGTTTNGSSQIGNKLENWGVVTIAANATSATATFHTPYASATTPVITYNVTNGTQVSIQNVLGQSHTRVSFARVGSATNAVTVNWRAVGIVTNNIDPR